MSSLLRNTIYKTKVDSVEILGLRMTIQSLYLQQNQYRKIFSSYRNNEC